MKPVLSSVGNAELSPRGAICPDSTSHPARFLRKVSFLVVGARLGIIRYVREGICPGNLNASSSRERCSAAGNGAWSLRRAPDYRSTSRSTAVPARCRTETPYHRSARIWFQACRWFHPGGQPLMTGSTPQPPPFRQWNLWRRRTKLGARSRTLAGRLDEMPFWANFRVSDHRSIVQTTCFQWGF